MTLPLTPPLEPMLARAAATIPEGPGWHFEPKWDGFRCLVVRDGGVPALWSRGGRDLSRYFPELAAPLAAQLPDRVILDGELVVAGPGGLSFDLLAQRIHPAASRIARLAGETPASLILFDLLALADRSYLDRPLADRLDTLHAVTGRIRPPVHRCPTTTDPDVAADWFTRFEGAGLDGVVAKRLDDPYTPGARTLVKVKHRRTADCVVGGYRLHKDGAGVGSLQLGLWDPQGRLHHIGSTGSLPATRRAALLDELAPWVLPEGEAHPWVGDADPAAGARRPGADHRWARGDKAMVAVRPERVVEVAYDQLTAGRFRHNATLLRWRDDRDPASCRLDQLEVVPPAELVAFTS